MIKLSVSETKWSSLLARTRALILYILIWIFDFGPVKLPGLSRNGPQGRVNWFRKGFWNCYWGDRKKWPIADRRVPSKRFHKPSRNWIWITGYISTPVPISLRKWRMLVIAFQINNNNKIERKKKLNKVSQNKVLVKKKATMQVFLVCSMTRRLCCLSIQWNLDITKFSVQGTIFLTSDW